MFTDLPIAFVLFLPQKEKLLSAFKTFLLLFHSVSFCRLFKYFCCLRLF